MMTSMQLSTLVDVKKMFGKEQGRLAMPRAWTPSLLRLFRRLGQILPEEQAEIRDGVRKLVGE